MDEEEAIRRSQEGEHNAFRFLVERHSRVLHGTAYLMTQDRTLAEDMAQEALLLAWRGLPSFKGGTNFRAWLLRILVNRTISERRRRRMPETEVLEEVHMQTDSNQNEEMALREEERLSVARALEALPQEQRETVVLRFYSDLTVPEVARALGCREGTVKSRLHRAMARLRERLQGEEAQSTVLGQEG